MLFRSDWTNGAWVQRGDALTPADGAALDTFGWSVWLSADGNTAIVGGPGDEVEGNAQQGSARVFMWDGTAWVEGGPPASSADTIIGTPNADTLDGGAGADLMIGRAGNDVYIVDDAGDVVREVAGGGTDVVRSSVDHALRREVEHLVLTGSGAINGTGNALANVITGNDGANRLEGGTGADTLDGGAGADTLTGGHGQDLLMGGLGADVFIFGSLSDSGTTIETADEILDLVDSDFEEDRIDLSALDANQVALGNQDFVFIGAAAFSAAGQLRYEYDYVLDFGMLYASTDADSDAEFALKLLGVSSLTQQDLVL